MTTKNTKSTKLPASPPLPAPTGSAARPLQVTEEENNYLWHLADDHKMTTTGEEPDAAVLCLLLQKIGDLRKTLWPNDADEP